MSVTSACADFTLSMKYEDIPAEAVKWTKWAMLDCTGVGFPGAKSALGKTVADYLDFVGGKPQARIVGLSIATSATEAAMANGSICHALDYDDVGGFGHPTTVLLPVIYALADLVKPTGKQAIEAYVAGYEVGNAMADRNTFGKIDTSSWELGWHPTGPHGSIAAAATASRLLGLTKQQAIFAMGIAASEASGIHKNFGTMGKPLHAGLAARNGVFAALMAQRGFTADADALGGKSGFLRAFKGPGDYSEEVVCRNLGKTYSLERGVAIKWYPACWSTHRATTSLIALMEANKLKSEDVERIEVDLRPVPLLHFNPVTGLEGKFSMAFNLALGALKGWPDIDDYTAERTQEPAIRAMMQRVHNVADPADGSVNMVIVTKDGKRYDKNVKHAPGDPGFGLQEERNMKKFLACAAFHLKSDSAKKLADQFLNLEEVADVSAMMDVISGTKRQHTAATV